MIHTRLLMTLAGALLSAACGADQAQEQRDVTALDGSIQSARSELVRHEDAIRSATVLTVLPAEMDRHEHTIGDIMGMMDISLSGMTSRCSGSGMSTLPARMDALSTEMRSHRDSMTATASMEDARSQCTAHSERADGVLEAMQQSLGAISCVTGR
jgi:hypothetical protein